MTHTDVSICFVRRRLMQALACAPMVACVSAVRSAAAPCNDPEQLTSSEVALRESFEYTETSQHAGQSCRGCSFYSGDKAAACGACQMLNGPVNPHGHCSSWSARS